MRGDRAPVPSRPSGVIPRGDAFRLAPAAEPLRAADPPADWTRYVVAVVRHRWLVLALVVLGTAAGVIAARFLKPSYEAKATLLLESPRDGSSSPNPSVSAVLASQDGLNLVQSTGVVNGVVEDLRLYLHPESAADSAALAGFTAPNGVQAGEYRLAVDPTAHAWRLLDADGVLRDRGAVGDSVGRRLGFRWRPDPALLTARREVAFRVEPPWEAMQAVAKSLAAHADPGAHLLQLSLTDEHPVRAAATINAIAARTVAVAGDLNRRRTAALVDILGDQYQSARQSLAAAEEGLKHFQERNAASLRQRPTAISTSMDTQGDPATAHAFDLKLRLDQIEEDREAIEKVLAGPLSADREVDALSVLPSVQRSEPLRQALDEVTLKQAEIRALEFRYTKESAPVQQARSDLEALTTVAVPNLARGLLRELGTRGANLEPQVDSTFGYFQRLPAQALQEARATRRVANATDLADNLRRRYDDARIGLASSLPNLSVVDSAVVPTRPTFNFVPLVIVLAFLGSLLLAVIGVTIFDRVDPRIRRPEQITETMRLPILGALPRWRPGRVAGTPDPEMLESLRSLRLRLLSAPRRDGLRMVTVTSPSSGDGKSFVAVNLALSFAAAGMRTLLVDGDVRGGAQHRVLGVSRTPGLTDVLAGEVSPTAAVRSTAHADLWLLPSGRRTPRAPELLLARSAEMSQWFRGEYDVMIVDSAPLAAGVDSLALAEVTGDLALVVRSGATELPLALSKLELLESMSVRVLGVVLNDVSGHDSFRYYTYDLSSYPDARDGASEDSETSVGILGGRPS